MSTLHAAFEYAGDVMAARASFTKSHDDGLYLGIGAGHFRWS